MQKQAITSSIIETKKLNKIFDYLQQNSLVIFDIDHTLIEPTQTFGGTAWAYDLTAKLIKKGFSTQQATEKSYAIFSEIKKVMQFKAVEPTTSAIIKKLKNENIDHLALTMRIFSMAESTKNDLMMANIDFEQQAIYTNTIQLNNEAGYQKGILYSGPMINKGKCLLWFLEEIGYIPQHILFVDDSARHVQNVHDVLTEENIAHHCIRYEATDSREANFDSTQADKELITTLGINRYQTIFQELL